MAIIDSMPHAYESQVLYDVRNLLATHLLVVQGATGRCTPKNVIAMLLAVTLAHQVGKSEILKGSLF